ncbi:MAG: ribosome maturation factor [Chitinophagaceae bacterium]|nr:MAG: ribosome maturation factor [Chitinophagaceae bacterium]
MAEVVEQIQSFLETLLEDTDIFIVKVKLRPTNNIEVFLDADEGLSVEKSARINRRLYNMIEDAEMFPDGDFSLEVSSPGVDEPLVSPRQFKKNIGRTVAVTLNDDSEKLGIMKDVDESRMVLEMKIPKKKETLTVEIPVTDIKKTVVQIVF